MAHPRGATVTAPPALLRIHERHLDTGATEVSIACPCARVGRLRTAWEDHEAVVRELLAEHARRAVLCPHRRSWDLSAASGSAPGAPR